MGDGPLLQDVHRQRFIRVLPPLSLLRSPHIFREPLVHEQVVIASFSVNGIALKWIADASA
jgi:hypothetical protein